MKALLLDEPGDVLNLRVADHPLPEPGPGELRVRVAAAGLNPVDYKLAGRGNTAWTWPHVLGLDVAGTVDAVGDGVDAFAQGDRVFYHGDLTRPGGYAEFAVTTAHTTARIPEDLSFVQAAALPCAGLTAYQCLVRRLHIGAPDVVWIQGGAGGVGGYGIQIARHTGATVYTTASRANHDHVTALGAAAAIDYNDEDVVARLLELTDGVGVDAVLAAVDPSTADQGVAALTFGGGMACIAGLPTLADETFGKSISLHRVSLGAAHTSDNRRAQIDLASMATEFAALVAAGVVDAMVEEETSLDGVPEGLKRLEGRHVRGKIVARFD